VQVKRILAVIRGNLVARTIGREGNAVQNVLQGLAAIDAHGWKCVFVFAGQIYPTKQLSTPKNSFFFSTPPQL
jgi:hypothetical protein